MLNIRQLIRYLPFQLIIWLIYHLWAGINWYSYQPDKFTHIIKFKLFQILPGITISLLILLVFGYAISKIRRPLLLALFFIANSLVFAMLWAPIQKIFFFLLWKEEYGGMISLQNIIKTFNNHLFVFICLSSTPFIQYFWLKYKESKEFITKQFDSNKNNNCKKLEYDDKIYISNKYSPNFITLNSIVRIYADGYYSYAITSDNRKIALFQTLKKWEEMLPEEYFFRIHRSTIINVEQIKSIEELNNKTYKVFLKSNGDPLNMSRRFGLLFKERFKA